MFGFLWSTPKSDTNTQIPNIIPSPPPLPQGVSNGNTLLAAQSMDLMSTLSRIEYKMDIIIKKLDASERKVSKNIIIEKESIIDTPECMENSPPKNYILKGNVDFRNELMQKVKELKERKRMGESHGFLPLLITENYENKDKDEKNDIEKKDTNITSNTTPNEQEILPTSVEILLGPQK